MSRVTGRPDGEPPPLQVQLPHHLFGRAPRLVEAHPDRCREYAERSVGVAALYNEERGFMGAAELAERAVDSGKSVTEVVDEEKEED
jgi:aspartate ammonia-lyase